ncbi:hypothetical protein SAMD00019534_039330 [Acytostelium subglobosum LB1]|uniref:hypothetical protein n=1 Tax=Acytostelium subglobosum LB1 TaxID=1410327 RepID=UPI0006451A38|nr:hypothetical protein SAMD00019534_039330 [Acytostelium subglobosum LB1]GAM20758.1 hypothetical protein SAMD00019534_039330 [Acytostelium subglobosum LB1]|eukprot:XP_012755892.1 hypothetical protein SAMD00019534_039330 [Acytostelium subglobosum LB1]
MATRRLSAWRLSCWRQRLLDFGKLEMDNLAAWRRTLSSWLSVWLESEVVDGGHLVGMEPGRRGSIVAV